MNFAFETDDYCYFVLDFLPCGDLLSLMAKANYIKEEEAKFYVVQLLLALKELHSKRIIYRDLKLENVMVDLDGYIKLCDFGLSVQNPENFDISQNKFIAELHNS